MGCPEEEGLTEITRGITLRTKRGVKKAETRETLICATYACFCSMSSCHHSKAAATRALYAGGTTLLGACVLGRHPRPQANLLGNSLYKLMEYGDCLNKHQKPSRPLQSYRFKQIQDNIPDGMGWRAPSSDCRLPGVRTPLEAPITAGGAGGWAPGMPGVDP